MEYLSVIWSDAVVQNDGMPICKYDLMLRYIIVLPHDIIMFWYHGNTMCIWGLLGHWYELCSDNGNGVA